MKRKKGYKALLKKAAKSLHKELGSMNRNMKKSSKMRRHK